MITVDSKRTAWKLVNTLINASYHKDEKASKRAGYDVYTDEDKSIRVNDLNTRLEIIYADGTTENIYIDESITKIPKDIPEDISEKPETKPKNIKEKLTDKICELIDKEEYDNIYKLLELISDYKDIIE